MGKASPPSDARSLVGITLSGGYRTERLIDEAGRGVVLAAKDPSGHDVAVKVLRPEAATEEMLSRISREASILSKLNDRHVVPVLDVGHDLESDLVYLVMPLLQGVDVADLLERVGVLAPRTAARIALQASSALVAAHAAGVAYRDLRATKVFLENAAGGEIVVRMFGPGLRDLEADGLELFEQSVTARGVTASRTNGAPRSDRRADVFGLGAVLYQMLSGKPPRTMDRPSNPPGVAATARHVLHIQDAAPWVGAPIAAALQPAITSDVHRRYPSAEVFNEMLRAVIGPDETITPAMLVALDAEARAVIAERADHDADPLVGHSLGGRYKVERLIGRGGMGGVYEATSADGRKVAAKVIFRSVAGQDDQHLRRFIREARAATAIDSPHVVKTFELGTDLKLGSPFIAMELLSGIDVARLLQEQGPIQPPGIVRVFAQAARGLGAAHKVGIVHRDVKPANIFLHQEGEGGRVVVKVCDFGVAKRSEEGATHEITREGGVLGSPLYMSPEQAKTASHVDHRADVWALCTSLYQALSGNPPWDPNASLAELLLAICTHRVPPLAEVAPWVPEGLCAVVHKGLAREPEERWQSMEALVKALLPFARGTEELRMTDLVPVSDEDLARAPSIDSFRDTRGRVRVGRGSRNADVSRDEALEQTTLPAPRVSSPPSNRRAGLFIGAGVAVAAVIGVVALRPPPGTAPPAAPTYQVRAAIQRASLRVPEGATVRVNGEVRPVESGAVAIEGEAGDAFDVVVSAGGAERSARVILMKDGHTEPDRIDVPAAAASTPAAPATASAAPTATAVPAGATAAPTGVAASIAGARTSSPRAVPPPGASSTSTQTGSAGPSPPPSVKPKETW